MPIENVKHQVLVQQQMVLILYSWYSQYFPINDQFSNWVWLLSDSSDFNPKTSCHTLSFCTGAKSAAGGKPRTISPAQRPSAYRMPPRGALRMPLQCRRCHRLCCTARWRIFTGRPAGRRRLRRTEIGDGDGWLDGRPGPSNWRPAGRTTRLQSARPCYR